MSSKISLFKKVIFKIGLRHDTLQKTWHTLAQRKKSMPSFPSILPTQKVVLQSVKGLIFLAFIA